MLCKKCPHFKPYLLLSCLKEPFAPSHLFLDILRGYDKKGFHCRRVHGCELDDYGVYYGHYNPNIEYFNLPCYMDCPYYTEQYLHELYHPSKNAKCDYGVARFFRKKRVCQHCGNVILNKETECPICGFRQFRVDRGINEMALWHNILFIVVLLIAIFILKMFAVQ